MARFLRSINLATWLGAGSIVIIAVAVLAVALRSTGLFTDLAYQEGLSRAQLASAAAHEFLQRLHETVSSAARGMARLPGLVRALDQGDRLRIEQELKEHCQAAAMDACAVLEEAGVVAAYGAPMPWTLVADASRAQGRRFLFLPSDEGPVVIGAGSSFRELGRPLSRAFVLKRLDDGVMAEMHDQVGGSVRLTWNRTAGNAPDVWVDLHRRALSARRPVAARGESANSSYAASMPVPAGRGEVVAYLDVEVEGHSSDAMVRDLVARLGTSALGVILIGGLAGVFYGHMLVRPVTLLGKAARRIGRGDLTAPVPAGGVHEVATLCADMEEMRRNLVKLTESLRQREAEARTVLSGVVEGVFSVDAERRIRYANPQMARLLRRRPEDIIGQFCGDVLAPRTRQGVRPCEQHCPIVAAREGAAPSEAVESLRTPGGEIRNMVVVSAAPVAGQQVQILRDETELEAARRARDSVLANVTHEFRTPLAAQLASIELLRDKLDAMTPAERQSVLQSLQRGGLRLMQLIDNLLESVRVDAGQAGIRQHPVCLADVMAESETLTRPLLEQRGQQLLVELPEGLPMVLGDEVRLMQVFINLLANSIKFAPEGSVIRMGVALEDQAIAAWVENEGPAVPDADRSAIFRPFQRSDRDEPRAKGLGLGLWIVKSIVERHRGTVDLQRTAEGRTRFIVRLPVEAAT